MRRDSMAAPILCLANVHSDEPNVIYNTDLSCHRALAQQMIYTFNINILYTQSLHR